MAGLYRYLTGVQRLTQADTACSPDRALDRSDSDEASEPDLDATNGDIELGGEVPVVGDGDRVYEKITGEGSGGR